jgi:hypothetical protein
VSNNTFVAGSDVIKQTTTLPACRESLSFRVSDLYFLAYFPLQNESEAYEITFEPIGRFSGKSAGRS